MTISNIKIWFNKAVAGVVVALPHLFIVATAGYLLEIYVLKRFDWHVHLLWLYVVGSIFFCNRIASIKGKITGHDDVYKTGSGRLSRGIHRVFFLATLLLMSVGIVDGLVENKVLAVEFVCQMTLIWLFCTWMYYFNLLILKTGK